MKTQSKSPNADKLSKSKILDRENNPNQELSQPNSGLEDKKLGLEIAKLQSELKNSNTFEWAKAIGAFVTSLGIIGTLLLGLSQQRESRISRDEERFERNVTRLGSTQVAERLTGLAGIKPFLKSTDRSQQIGALTYLINAGVIESDPTVRSAIDGLFDKISDLNIQADVLNEGLTAARDRNRAVYSRAVNAFWEKQNEAKKRLVDPKYTEVPIGNPSPSEMAPLEISARMIAGFIRAGAKINDLSNIYCAKCVFSSLEKPANLAGVSFEQAILRRSDFSGAQLESASFHNADLVLTNFLGSNLSNSKLTADTTMEPWSISAAVYSGEMWSSYGAIFACSNLSNADLSGRMIFTLIYENDTYGGNMRDEFYNADLSGTKMSKIQYSIGVPANKLDSKATSSFFPLDLSPTDSSNFSKLTDPIHYFKETSLVIFTNFGNLSDKFKPIPNPYEQDLLISMSSLASARNLSKAELPQGIRQFIDDNSQKLQKPFISYNCATGQKNADISGMFAKAGTMTGNARF